MLFNRSDVFEESAKNALAKVKKFADGAEKEIDIYNFISCYVDQSEYSARLFEISMHALFQALSEMFAVDGFLKPLSQMRSANKKHGNVGDIEVTELEGGMQITEAWDAKYGKTYLRDELEELNEKLRDHPETAIAGFVVNGDPDMRKEIISRAKEIGEIHDCKIVIQGFQEWSTVCASRVLQEQRLERAKRWLTAFAESLCQMRRIQAPIDEPSDAWVKGLIDHIK
ncbi:hypothetical protein [Candidatus Enterovibrio escicola]|uniref:hypothetical protein n=1 Tax=Candidatus Enterovibrio escicola TaxID=1927127 RepID=UPI001237A622|nr:hypothetical protein [Candidatus Enterovibrio escacola]